MMFCRAIHLYSAWTRRLRPAGLLHHVRHVSRSVVNMGKDWQTHYDVLGVTPSASQKQIREAFVRLSKQVHPDMNSSDPKSTDKFLRLRDAYTVLSSPELRREYDMQLQRTRMHHWSDFTGEYVPPKQSHYRRDSTHSEQHHHHHQQQQQQQPTNEYHIRYFFNVFRDMVKRAPKQQQPRRSTQYDGDRSTLGNVLETFHRSTTYRPSATFFPVAIAVTVIAGCVCTVLSIFKLYVDSRTDRQREEMNRQVTEQRRLQQSIVTDE